MSKYLISFLVTFSLVMATSADQTSLGKHLLRSSRSSDNEPKPAWENNLATNLRQYPSLLARDDNSMSDKTCWICAKIIPEAVASCDFSDILSDEFKNCLCAKSRQVKRYIKHCSTCLNVPASFQSYDYSPSDSKDLGTIDGNDLPDDVKQKLKSIVGLVENFCTEPTEDDDESDLQFFSKVMETASISTSSAEPTTALPQTQCVTTVTIVDTPKGPKTLANAMASNGEKHGENPSAIPSLDDSSASLDRGSVNEATADQTPTIDKSYDCLTVYVTVKPTSASESQEPITLSTAAYVPPTTVYVPENPKTVTMPFTLFNGTTIVSTVYLTDYRTLTVTESILVTPPVVTAQCFGPVNATLTKTSVITSSTPFVNNTIAYYAAPSPINSSMANPTPWIYTLNTTSPLVISPAPITPYVFQTKPNHINPAIALQSPDPIETVEATPSYSEPNLKQAESPTIWPKNNTLPVLSTLIPNTTFTTSQSSVPLSLAPTSQYIVHSTFSPSSVNTLSPVAVLNPASSSVYNEPPVPSLAVQKPVPTAPAIQDSAPQFFQSPDAEPISLSTFSSLVIEPTLKFVPESSHSAPVYETPSPVVQTTPLASIVETLPQETEYSSSISAVFSVVSDLSPIPNVVSTKPSTAPFVAVSSSVQQSDSVGPSPILSFIPSSISSSTPSSIPFSIPSSTSLSSSSLQSINVPETYPSPAPSFMEQPPAPEVIQSTTPAIPYSLQTHSVDSATPELPLVSEKPSVVMSPSISLPLPVPTENAVSQISVEQSRLLEPTSSVKPSLHSDSAVIEPVLDSSSSSISLAENTSAVPLSTRPSTALYSAVSLESVVNQAIDIPKADSSSQSTASVEITSAAPDSPIETFQSSSSLGKAPNKHVGIPAQEIQTASSSVYINKEPETVDILSESSLSPSSLEMESDFETQTSVPKHFTSLEVSEAMFEPSVFDQSNPVYEPTMTESSAFEQHSATSIAFSSSVVSTHSNPSPAAKTIDAPESAESFVYPTGIDTPAAETSKAIKTLSKANTTVPPSTPVYSYYSSHVSSRSTSSVNSGSSGFHALRLSIIISSTLLVSLFILI